MENIIEFVLKKRSFTFHFWVTILSGGLWLFIYIGVLIYKNNYSHANYNFQYIDTSAPPPEKDPLLFDCIDLSCETGYISSSLLQRKFKIGYTRAASLLDKIEELNIISPFEGISNRQVLITKEHWDSIKHYLTLENIFDNKQLIVNQSTVENDFDKMSGEEFEVFCCNILKQNGFSDVSTTKHTGDYGIDILAKKDEITFAIQCKCYSDNVGNKAVQEAFSGKSFYNCMVGAVLTNRYFTPSAKETAKKNNILLWDRDKLSEFIDNIK